MPQPKKLTEQKHDAIINAAVQIFQQQGFAHSSMDKIAAAAGVSKRTVYNHFASKELLFDEILRQLWERSDQEIDYSYYPDRPIKAQLTAILAAKTALLADKNYQNLARVVLAEMIHSPQLAQSVVQTIANKETHLNKWLEQANLDRRIACSDIAFAANQLHGLIKGFCFWPQITIGLASPSSAETTHIIEQTVTMFLLRYGTDNQ
ncbi:TetR/AcrR family transcriptional regulator [Simiduia curdlanivorans]|uniref:TetR/AcrR family transcriptional regulator n=1 Tax=Simiduia curdlanivorans TaxID=1492769 RepID=A0ABV8V275_9GAMM|nr:TetR/AcrR family transcriptional regulator [Simiduia curdlanivorans]MDN3637816.1 TetR/AcrR family transcriptional regulator [Simiduia curdlanivorans]